MTDNKKMPPPLPTEWPDEALIPHWENARMLDRIVQLIATIFIGIMLGALISAFYISLR